MLKEMAIAVFLSIAVFAQTHTPVVHFEQLDEIGTIKCKGQVPETFGCAILYDAENVPGVGNLCDQGFAFAGRSGKFHLAGTKTRTAGLR